MPDRRSSFRLTLLLVAVVVMLAPPSSLALDEPPVPVSDNLLDRPIVDVALLARSDGQPPDLITLSTDGQVPGGIEISVLRRDGTWSSIAEETITVRSATGAARPWLVDLGGGRFAVLSGDSDEHQTSVVGISVAGASEIRHPLIRTITTVDMFVTDAGAADIDGDGVAELVVAGSSVPSGTTALCDHTRIAVFDGTSLAPRATFGVPDVRLAGAAIGEWDDAPGADLLAYTTTFDPCVLDASTSGTGGALTTGLRAIRLSDGSTIADMPSPPEGGPVGVPLAFDLDGDGVDEALVREGPSLVLADPSRGWSTTSLATDSALPLLAARGAGLERTGGRIAWFESGGTRLRPVLSMTNVLRAPSGEIVVVEPSSMDLPGPASTRGELGLAIMEQAASLEQVPAVWRGDLDGDGCPEVLAPLVTAECDGQRVLRAGALWLATRPLAAFDAGPVRELLVAPAIDWDPGLGGPMTPTPSAAGAPGAWRHGPSARFALSELRAGDATYFMTYPIPRPTIDRIAARDRATDVPGFTGSRVLVRSVTTRIKDRRPPVAPPLDAFLGGSTAPGERVSLSRIAVPAGAEAGRDGSFVRVPLPDILTGDVGPVEGWAVSMSQINDWGEIALPVAGTVTRDTTGPSLALEIPFTSAPWPWHASLQGRSETGVLVSLAGEAPVATDRFGRFVLETQLAPWPQTVELTGVDLSGNVTTTRFSVVGGIDYRTFPWPAILAAILMIGALVGAVRSGRNGSTVREVIPVSLDDEAFPEIEDLPSGTRL
jgi:hypothetical protein